MDGTENDVVVAGDTVPTDAPTAADALDTWINDGADPGGDWEMFTATDPEAVGWRWAAINQKTGTVVYVR